MNSVTPKFNNVNDSCVLVKMNINEFKIIKKFADATLDYQKMTSPFFGVDRPNNLLIRKINCQMNSPLNILVNGRPVCDNGSFVW